MALVIWSHHVLSGWPKGHQAATLSHSPSQYGSDTSNKWTINAQLCALNPTPSSLVPLDLLRFFLVLVLTHWVPERRQKTTRGVVVHVCILISSHVLRMLVQVVSTFSRPVSCLFGQVCRHKNMCIFDISASSTNSHVSGMCASSRHVNIPAHNITFIASSMSKSSRNLHVPGHPVCVQIQLLTPPQTLQWVEVAKAHSKNTHYRVAIWNGKKESGKIQWHTSSSGG